MNARPANLHTLIAKIGHLSPQRAAQVEDFVDFLVQREASPSQAHLPTRTGMLEPPLDDLGAWPTDMSLRREDLYGDDGR